MDTDKNRHEAGVNKDSGVKKSKHDFQKENITGTIGKGEMMSSRGIRKDATVPVKVESNTNNSGPEAVSEQRDLRSRYLAVKNLICDDRHDISRVDSQKFNLMINEMESLHQLVQKPREQVTDAEALLDITNTLVSFVKTHNKDGVTPSYFVSCLVRYFGREGGVSCTSGSIEDLRNTVRWKDIGLAVSHIYQRAPGCCTMLGHMNNEPKQRALCCTMLGPMSTQPKQGKTAVRKKRVRPTECALPEELCNTITVRRSDTDDIMAAMFDSLRKKRRVRLENLVLNRNSFAQTVENIFALSFLVKDGRAEMSVNEEGVHLVSPRNAPTANSVVSGEICYSHFVFRFDFCDWKLMMDSVEFGEELMLHRNQVAMGNGSRRDPTRGETQTGLTTPIRKNSRNRGLVLQEQPVAEGSLDTEDPARRANGNPKGKTRFG